MSGCSKRDSTMAGKAAGNTPRHRGRGVGQGWRKCGDNRRCRGFVKGYLVHLLDVGGERVSAVPQDDLLQEHEGALVVHVLTHLRQGKGASMCQHKDGGGSLLECDDAACRRCRPDAAPSTCAMARHSCPPQNLPAPPESATDETVEQQQAGLR